jgi:hypothetical protein
LIPARLQSDLMDFNTYGLDQNGLFLITASKKSVTYYGLILNFQQIDISPEQIKEKEFIKEKNKSRWFKTL